jgi:hypothetical protein
VYLLIERMPIKFKVLKQHIKQERIFHFVYFYIFNFVLFTHNFCNIESIIIILKKKNSKYIICSCFIEEAAAFYF